MESLLTSQQILDFIPDGFFLMDKDWIIRDCNPKALEILNQKWEDFRDKHLFEAFPASKNSVFETNYHLCISQKTSVRFEEFYNLYDRWFEVTAFYSGDKFPGIGVFFRDITERKNIQKLREDLISKLSLELYTPLSSIQGSIQLMQEDANSALSHQFQSLLKIASKNTNTLVKIINEILEIKN